MEKLDAQIKTYARHMEHLRARMLDDARDLVAKLESPDTSATSIHLKAGAIENAAGVLYSCEVALHALKAAR